MIIEFDCWWWWDLKSGGVRVVHVLRMPGVASYLVAQKRVATWTVSDQRWHFEITWKSIRYTCNMYVRWWWKKRLVMWFYPQKLWHDDTNKTHLFIHFLLLTNHIKYTDRFSTYLSLQPHLVCKGPSLGGTLYIRPPPSGSSAAPGWAFYPAEILSHPESLTKTWPPSHPEI